MSYQLNFGNGGAGGGGGTVSGNQIYIGYPTPPLNSVDAEKRVLLEALQFVETNVGARPQVTESYIMDHNIEDNIMKFVTKSIKSQHNTLWNMAKEISNAVENRYGGIWGCVVGVHPCALSMMGGRDHLSIRQVTVKQNARPFGATYKKVVESIKEWWKRASSK